MSSYSPKHILTNRRSFMQKAGLTSALAFGQGSSLLASHKSGNGELSAEIETGILQSIYVNSQSKLTVTLERVDVLIKSQEYTLNFPGYFTFDGKDALVYGLGRHGGDETRPAVISIDQGKTWDEPSPDSPFMDNMQNAGLQTYLKDGTFLYMDTYPIAFDWKIEDGTAKHWTYRLTEFTWRLRRFSAKGDLIKTSQSTLLGLPWEAVSKFELYGTILELDNGDFLAPFLVHPGRLEDVPDGMSRAYSVVIARSTDRAETFRYVTHFSHEVDGEPVGDQGASEPDLALLANGDILCLMRSGSRTPMYQTRSTDGGKTWSEHTSIGWPGVKPKLRVLGNGVLVCSTGRGAYGNPQVTCLMLSIDGTGERWEAPFNFHTGPGCSYTWNIERNGKLEIIYSHSSFTKPIGTCGLPYQSIKRAVFDIRSEPRT